MTIKNLSLAFYSAIFTAFAIKLVNKFKMSFRGAESGFHDCQPPYTEVSFEKFWHTSNGRIQRDAKSVVLGPKLKTRDARRKLANICLEINCTDGFSFERISSPENLPPGVRVGDNSQLKDIMTCNDIFHIVGHYYELLSEEAK